MYLIKKNSLQFLKISHLFFKITFYSLNLLLKINDLLKHTFLLYINHRSWKTPKLS